MKVGMSRAGARGLTEVIDMSANERIENSLDTGSILRHARVFGIKTMTVVVTASMLLSGLPTAAIAEGLEEAGVIAAQSETEASTQDTNITVDEDATATDGSDTAAESSDQQDNSAAQNTPASEEQTATEADVALDLGSAYITYNGQDIALPSTKVTVPTAKDFTFSVAANTGFDLTAVKLTVNGSESELTADANGTYTVTAAQVAAGASLKLETEEQAAEAAASNNAIAITSLEDEGEDEADQTADDQSDANTIAVVSDFDGSITGNDTLEVGKFAVYTAEGFSGTVLWTTSNPSIAKVESNGVVTAVATGTVTITAQSGDETETASKIITVVEPSSASGYEATITSTIENAEVAYFAWHDTSDTSSISFGRVTGTVTISDYTTWNKPGYVVFFVKPNSNHIVTGLGASGNGDIYAVDATDWGNINVYPNIAQVMAAARAAGYVAAFGFSRSARQSMTQDFTISAKSPDMTVTAVSDKTTGVKAGDNLTFTVTITPQTTGSGKDSVESVQVNSADVNGTKVTVESITGNTDGTFTGTVHYTATKADVARGKVVLTVEATSTYKGAYTITSGDIASSATVTKEAECECLIAPASQVDYKFVSGTSGKSLPGAIKAYLPSDHSSYDAGETVTAIDPEEKVYEDSDHDGYWTFTGWDKNSAVVDGTGKKITFTGTWKFTQYSKYQVKYVDAAGKELLTADPFSGAKVGDKVKVVSVIPESPIEGYSYITPPSIEGYSYSTSDPEELEIGTVDSENVITLIYKKVGLKLDANGYSGTYDGASHKGTVTVNDTVDTTIEYSTDGGKTWSTDAPTITDVERADDGTVSKIHVTVRAYNPNYTCDSVEKALTKEYDLEVLPRTITVKAEDERVYNGGDQTLTITATNAVAPTDTTGLVSGEALSLDGATVTGCFVGEYTNVATYTWSVAKGDEAKTDSTGNYTISVTGKLTITAQSINKDDKSYTGATVSDPTDSVYSGTKHKWVPTVTSAEHTTLTEGADYDVTYKRGEDVTTDFTNVGTITVIITAKGRYTGTVTKTYKITKAPVKVTTLSATKAYNGEPLTMTEGTAITDLQNGETATVKATGTQTEVGSSENSYKIEWGTAQESNYYVQSENLGTLTVKPQSIDPGTDPADPDKRYDGATVNSPSGSTYDAGAHKWEPEVKNGNDVVLEKGTDYTVVYKRDGKETTDFTNAGTITVEITGKGSYAGTVEREYKITPASLTVTTADASKTYDGEPLTKADGATITGLVNGETAKIVGTGTITEVGSTSNTYKITWAAEGNDYTAKQGNYQITGETLGQLTITESDEEIVVTTTGGTFTYDGQAHGATVSVGTLPKGYTVQSATSDATATDVTTTDVKATVNDLVIVNASGKDVTKSLNIKKVDGTIKITPAPLTITTYGNSKTYDGTALTESGKIDGLVNNESAELVTTGSQTEVGQSDNTYTINWNDTAKQDNYEVTTEHIGKLTVTPIQVSLIVVPKSVSKTYDGTPLTGSEANVYGTLPEGYTYEYTLKGSQTNAGWSYVEVDTFKILDSKKNDVTSRFTGYNTEAKGTLTVNKRKVTLTSESGSKNYDGKKISRHGVEVSGDGFATGEGVSENYTFYDDDFIVPGQYTNIFDYQLKTGTDANNYEITKIPGTLTINKKNAKGNIELTTSNLTKTYDGTSYNAPTATATVPYGNTAVIEYSVDNEKWVTDPAKISVKDVADSKTVYVRASNLYFEGYVTGTETLTINKREVTVTSANATKVYDGTALTKHDASVSPATGLVTGETLAYSFTGSRTEVGSEAHNNTFTVDWAKSTAAEGNYTVTCVPGTLTVTAQSINPEDSDSYKNVTVDSPSDTTYNGEEHKWVPTVKAADGKTLLEIDKDYTVTYKRSYNVTEDFTNAGYITVVITGKNNYSGTVERTYEIKKREITITSANGDFVYNGTSQKMEKADVTSGEFVEGQGVESYTYTKSVKNVGDKADNEFTYVLNDKTSADNYEITKVHGKLTVRKSEESIVVTLNDYTGVYDGQEHKATSNVAGKLPDGFTTKVVSNAAITNVGETTAKIDSFFIYDTDGKDVTDQFKDITTTDTATLKVTKRKVTVTSADATKVYDGTELTNHEASVTSLTRLVEGETLAYSFTGSQTEVGGEVGNNTFTVDWKKSTALEGNYTVECVAGTLTVTPQSIDPGTDPENPDKAYKGVEINSPSDSTYDAKAHKWAPTVTDAEGNKLTADTDYTVTYKRNGVGTTDFTNVGTITVVISGKGNYSGEVTRTYKITPAAVTLKSNTRVFVYNGSDQGDNEVNGDGAFSLFKNQTTLLAATGTVRNVGDTAVNTIKYTMAAGFDASNYSITLDEGNLSVTAKSIETGDDIDVSKLENLVYTGLSQEQKPDVTDGNTALVEDKDYDVTFSEDTVNVGTVTVTVTGKGNYTGKVERTYQITPAPLTVTTEGATKVYDGTPLTNENGSIEGLVNGELATVVTNGSQTKVGTSQNGYTIDWDTAAESNYKIVSDKLGDLTVTPQSIDPGTDPENPDPAYKGVEINDASDSVYDGTEHKWIPVVKDADGNELVEGTDYDVAYDTSDFVNSGTITVTITGKGEYTGTVTKTYRITPAALHVVTASASKTYDGSALTSTTVTVTGLVKGDEIVVTATGAQTQVGSSKNTYSIDWQQVSKDNYTLTDELGTLTVTAAPAPAPDDGGNTPTTPTTPSNNNGGNIIDTIVDGMDDAYRTITGDTEDDAKKDEEKITDDETPLANLDKKRDVCWAHWYMLVCALATVVYGIFVGMRRTKHTRRLEDDLNDILNNDESKN